MAALTLFIHSEKPIVIVAEVLIAIGNQFTLVNFFAQAT
jgi:hypothetical protein